MPVSATSYSYAQAVAICAGTINGLTGWRLPTKDELLNLYNSGAMNYQGWTKGPSWSSTILSSGLNYTVALNGLGVGYSNTTTDYAGVTCVHP